MVNKKQIEASLPYNLGDFLRVWIAYGLAASVLYLAFPPGESISDGEAILYILFILAGTAWVLRRRYLRGIPPAIGGFKKLWIFLGYYFGVGSGLALVFGALRGLLLPALGY